MSKRPVVGVLGHYGNRNLGDEAIVTATIQQLRSRLHDPEIVCFSLRPTDTAYRHQVECFSVCCLPRFAEPTQPLDAEAADLPWRRHETSAPGAANEPAAPCGWKTRLKALPVVGTLARGAAGGVGVAVQLARELKFTIKAAKYLRRLDLLVVAGSNQFLDNFGGTWDFPFTLLRWSLLARLTRTRIAYVSVGAGPLDRPLSKLFIRLAVRLADYVSYRDTPSKVLIEAGLPRVRGLVYPDLAFGLDFDLRQADLVDASGKPVVGINPMPVYDHRYWFEHDEVRYRSYIEKLAALAARMMAAGNRVFFFPTMWRDDDVIRDVLESMSSRHGVDVDANRHFRPNSDVKELIAVLQEADIIVATRFHGVVLSYHVGVPVLGIGYFRKTLALMDELGQTAYHEDLEDCDVERLWSKFLALETQLEAERRKLADRTAEYRRQVAEQWDTVVGLIASGKSVICEPATPN